MGNFPGTLLTTLFRFFKLSPPNLLLIRTMRSLTETVPSAAAASEDVFGEKWKDKGKGKYNGKDKDKGEGKGKGKNKGRNKEKDKDKGKEEHH